MIRKIIIFCLILMPIISGFHHPFFIAVFDLEYSSKEKELGISCKIYPDDLEAALKQFTKKNIDISAGNKEDNNKVVESYFRKHVGIKINGIPTSYRFLGYENENDATWIFFNIPSLMNVKSVGITTDMMYEYKDEQTNIVHITIDGKRKSFKLNAPSKEAIAKRE